MRGGGVRKKGCRKQQGVREGWRREKNLSGWSKTKNPIDEFGRGNASSVLFERVELTFKVSLCVNLHTNTCDCKSVTKSSCFPCCIG